MDSQRVTLHHLVTEVVRDAGVPVSYADIMKSIISLHNIGTEQSIKAAIVMCTVNNPGRLSSRQNQRARLEPDPRYDTLYRVGKGIVELYKPEKHGKWGIVEQGDRCKIHQLDDMSEGTQAMGAGRPSIMSTIEEQGWDASRSAKSPRSSEKTATASLVDKLSAGMVDHTPGRAKHTTTAPEQDTTGRMEHPLEEGGKDTPHPDKETEAAQHTTSRGKSVQGDRRENKAAIIRTNQEGVTAVDAPGQDTQVGGPPVETVVRPHPPSRIASLFPFLQRDPTILGLGARRCTSHDTPVVTDFGVIDFLAEDDSGTLTVVTEARSSVLDEQLLFFALLKWVRTNLANGRTVRGVLVVPDDVDASAIAGLFKNATDKRIFRLGVSFESIV